jgi:hypothetical protein
MFIEPLPGELKPFRKSIAFSNISTYNERRIQQLGLHSKTGFSHHARETNEPHTPQLGQINVA